MDITEVLTVKLGKPIASVLLKLWLGEPAASIGGALVDIAASRIQDLTKKREAARHFEGIGERMVLQLRPLFEHASRSGHLSIEAVAAELGTTLEGHISADFLVQWNLDPSRLAHALRTARPLPAGHFSEAETQLYEHALDQAARYLTEVASLLPRFEVTTVAAQLRRLSNMGALIEETLATVSRVEQEVGASQARSHYERFAADYRQAVSRNVDRLELLGVDVVEEQFRRYELSVAYISLSLQRGAKDEDAGQLEPAESVFAGLPPNSGRLLIRGEAGSGKSTLLKWMAWTAARLERAKLTRDATVFISHGTDNPTTVEHYRPGTRGAWRSHIPFLLRLRDCKDGKLPSIENLTSHCAAELGKPPEGWVRSVLKSGRSLLLIDGVDEVPRKMRRQIRDDLEALVKTYSDNIYILTTRPAAIPEDWLTSLGFRTAEVSPLSPSDRDQLIDRWHAAVARQLELVGRPSSGIVELAQNLKASLRENPAIARLATNPLLAAAICALHRQRNQQLPQTQAELAEDLCKMLLHQREAETPNLSVEPAAYRELSFVQKRRIVEALAHDMVANGRSMLDKIAMQRRIGAMLARMGKSESATEEVLEGLVERSGLLRESSPGKFDFIHNTLKEYLAAIVFAAERQDGLLANNALDPSWQQVLVFAAAKGESSFVESLIKMVLEGDEKPQAGRKSSKSQQRRSSDAERQRRFMAVRLETAAVDLQPELRQRLGALRQQLFPPATMTEAEALASAGDSVVRFLHYRETEPARKIAASVRALGLIASSAARDVLREYVRDSRWTVVEELTRVLNPLEIDRVRQALVNGEQLSRGIRSQMSDLSPIIVFLKGAEIPTLDLSESRVQDISPLAHLSSLLILDLTATLVQDISPLAHLSSLQILNLNETQVQDISPLAQLSSLHTLDLNDTQVQNISPLAHLSSLGNLDLSETHINDISPLAQLSSLEDLDLSETQVEDIKPLAQLSSLRNLKLSGTQVQDISPLAQLSSLEDLDLSGTQVEDIRPLAQLSSLRNLNLRETQVREISPLAQLSSLQVLDLSGTQVQNIRPLAQISSLRRLNLGGTQVQDFSPLARLSSVQRLYLNETQIHDIRPLAQISSLKFLKLSGTPVRDVSPLAQLSSLEVLILDGTLVQDVSSLAPLSSLRPLHLDETGVRNVDRLAQISSLEIIGVPL